MLGDKHGRLDAQIAPKEVLEHRYQHALTTNE